jgi:CheY-like chemotaxis protein
MATDITDLNNIRVLVVDDEDFYRGLIVRILEQIGINHIEQAADGAAAVGSLATFKPDLVIVDIMMEPMNGLKLLKMIRIGMTDAPGDLPAIVLTGLSDAGLMGAALALDCDAFLKKDAGPDAIRDKIARVISTPRQMKTTDSYGAVAIPSVDSPPQQALPVEPKKPSSASSIEIPVYELQAGAVLDQDLMSEEGYLMYAAETALREADVARLQDLSEVIGLQTVIIRQ